MTPYEVEISRSLKWMHNKAPAMTSLVLAKERWYDANQKQFWASWLADVFDLRTANDFGMLVWCMILGVPSDQFSFSPPKHQFAYGAERENFVWTGARTPEGVPYDPLANDIGGNFSAGRSGSVYDPEEIRRLLQIRYAALISDGSISFVNYMLRWVFNDGQPWDFDAKRYFYVTDESISSYAPLLATTIRVDSEFMGTRYGQQGVYYNAFLWSASPDMEPIWQNSITTSAIPADPSNPNVDGKFEFFEIESLTPDQPNEVFLSQTVTHPIVPTGQVRFSFIAKGTPEQQTIRVTASSNTGTQTIDFNILYGNFEQITPNDFGTASMEALPNGTFLVSMMAPRVAGQPINFRVSSVRLKQTVFGSPSQPHGKFYVSSFQSESTEFIPWFRKTTTAISGSAQDWYSQQAPGNELYNPSFNVISGDFPNGYEHSDSTGVTSTWDVVATESDLAIQSLKAVVQGLDGTASRYSSMSNDNRHVQMFGNTLNLYTSVYCQGPVGTSMQMITKYYNATGVLLGTSESPVYEMDNRLNRYKNGSIAGFGEMIRSVSVEYRLMSSDPAVTEATFIIERPEIEKQFLIAGSGIADFPWNDTENPGSRPGPISYLYIPYAGDRLYWKGSWGSSNSGEWNYGVTFDGSQTVAPVTVAIGKPSDYIEPVLSGRIEYRIGIGLGLTTRLIEILRDDNIRILPTFAGLKTIVKLES